MPYDYPAPNTPRKHAPAGYPRYRSYRPWLRDEFNFRCVYCLKRETWVQGPELNTPFPIDHILPVAEYPERVNLYENLAYSCWRCNFLKSDEVFIPSPLVFLNSDRLKVSTTGQLVFDEASDVELAILVKSLDLDSQSMISVRAEIFEEFDQLSKSQDESARDKKMFLRKFGYPEDLPDLANLEKPPKANAKPESIAESSFQRRQEGTLPEFYC